MVWSAFLAYVKLPGCKTHKQKVRILQNSQAQCSWLLQPKAPKSCEIRFPKVLLADLSWASSRVKVRILRVVHDIMKQKATKSNQNVEIKYSKQYQRILSQTSFTLVVYIYNTSKKHWRIWHSGSLWKTIWKQKHRNTETIWKTKQDRSLPMLPSLMSGMSSALAHCKVVQCHTTKKTLVKWGSEWHDEQQKTQKRNNKLLSKKEKYQQVLTCQWPIHRWKSQAAMHFPHVKF